jgi:hypothetical protein
VFSARLDRLRQFNRLAVLAAATLLLGGIVLIALWTVRALKMLETAEVDRAPIIIGVLVAFALLVVLCLVVYVAVRLSTASHHVKFATGRLGTASRTFCSPACSRTFRSAPNSVPGNCSMRSRLQWLRA